MKENDVLTASQQSCLEEMVRRMGADLHLETARLEADQTLEVVVCRDFVCFRPIRIAPPAVDVAAALAGNPNAQHALQNHLRTALQGVLDSPPAP